jgi:hypothetical protein
MFDADLQVFVDHGRQIERGGDNHVDECLDLRLGQQVDGGATDFGKPRLGDGAFQVVQILANGVDVALFVDPLVAKMVAVERVVQFLFVNGELVADLFDAVEQDDVLPLAARWRRLRQSFDGDAQLIGFLQLFEPTVEAAHGGAVGQQALEGAGQEQGHDGGDQAEPEHQLVANPPGTGHAPTSLSAAASWSRSVFRQAGRNGMSAPRYPVWAGLYQKHALAGRAVL